MRARKAIDLAQELGGLDPEATGEFSALCVPIDDAEGISQSHCHHPHTDKSSLRDQGRCSGTEDPRRSSSSTYRQGTRRTHLVLWLMWRSMPYAE
jgi:hypothetical protein